MKVLHITTLQRSSGWLADAFAFDRASQVVLDEAVGVTAGIARLRDEVFDAVLVTHHPGVLDSVELIEGLRAGGSDEPMIVLGDQSDQELTAHCYEVGADAYCGIQETTTRTLIWTVARAIERRQLIRENYRLVQSERQRLRHEHQEAERLLDQQRSLVSDLELLCERDPTPVACRTDGGPSSVPHVPTVLTDEGVASPLADDDPSDGSSDQGPPQMTQFGLISGRLAEHYRELLRAYVVMGMGNLTKEMVALADLLASTGVTARQTMQLHVRVLEELIQGLGNRSARHVMNRADLLVLEVMVHLAEGYRTRLSDRLHPPQQSLLPGFDP